jgi:citrate synthase
MADKKFELTDLASGKKSLLPVKSGTIGPDVLDIAAINKDHGVFTHDPGFGVTSATESKITYIDGDAGVLLLPRLPDRAARRKIELLEVSLPAAERRAADAKAELEKFNDDIRITR